MFTIFPHQKNKPIRVFLNIFLLLSLLSVFFPMIYSCLSLSLVDVKKGFIWQLFTFFLIQTQNHFSFGFVIQIILSLYALWILSPSLIGRGSSLKFFLLYFFSGIFSGLCGLLWMSFVPNSPLRIAGSFFPLYSLLLSWIMLNPKSILFVLHVIPIRVKSFVSILIGSFLSYFLLKGYFLTFAQSLGALLFGYIFTFFAFQVHGPFPFLKKFEAKIFQFFFRRPLKSFHKIYDFETGKPLDDEPTRKKTFTFFFRKKKK